MGYRRVPPLRGAIRRRGAEMLPILGLHTHMPLTAWFSRAAARLALGAVLLAMPLAEVPPLADAPPLADVPPLGVPLAPSQGSAATLNVPANATAEQLRDASLRQLGWTDAALSYVSGNRSDGHPRVLLTFLPNQQNGCKVGDGNCLTGYFPSNHRVQITIDPGEALFARGFAHEYGHAVDDARGFSDTTIGSVLYDLLELSQDPTRPEAAWGARQILQLRDDDSGFTDTLGYHAMLDHKDYSHLSIALLEFGVGNDAAKLPDWFRQAYYPYLQPGTPRLSRPVQVPIDRVPQDIAARTQRVVDLIAQYCGPVLAGAQTHASTTCVGHTRPWPDVPYLPYPGAESTGPAAPGVPHAPLVEVPPVVPSAPTGPPPPVLPAPVVSHIADQGVVTVARGAAQGVIGTITAAVAPSGPGSPQVVQTDSPSGVQTLLVLPPVQAGLSPDEGCILTPSDAIGRLYYFVAGGQRFNLTEAEVQGVVAANPLVPLYSTPRPRIAQYVEAAPPGQGQLGVLESLDTLPSPIPDA